MKTLCLILLFHGSLQLQCDKADITVNIGGEFLLVCTYDISRFRYSKKYWCRGDSRNTCEILVDSEHKHKSGGSTIVDAGRRGLYVKVTNLQFHDTGVYWVGIDKVYADIMASVSVVITDVPVSKPKLWALSSLEDRSTCWGQPVTVRCGCAKGTGIQYTWYQHTHHKHILLHQSSDLGLHCGTVEQHSDYHCVASNDISSEGSDILSVQVLMPANISCIYVVNVPGQSIYDCADRMSTTTATTSPLTTCQATNQSLQTNQTDDDLFFTRAYTGVPLWYMLLRLCSFMSLLTSLCIVLKCIKIRRKTRAKRERITHHKQRRNLAR